MTVQGLPTFNVYSYNDLPSETIPLNVTSVSSSVTFALLPSIRCRDIMITQAGPATVFYNTGLKSVGVTAVVPGTNGTVGATPLLSGAIYNFQKNSDSVPLTDTIAAICAGSGTATIYITAVQGS